MTHVENLKSGVAGTDQILIQSHKRWHWISLQTFADYLVSEFIEMGAFAVTDITGDLIGNVTGNFTGQHRHLTQTLTASGEVTVTSGVVVLDSNDAPIVAEFPAPVAGDEYYIVNVSSEGTQFHAIQLPAGVTWDGTNTVLLMEAAEEAYHVVAVSATEFVVLEHIDPNDTGEPPAYLLDFSNANLSMYVPFM